MSIVFLLVVNLCTSTDHCHWERIRSFYDEDRCHAMGRDYLAAMPSHAWALGYKCVVQVKERQGSRPRAGQG